MTVINTQCQTIKSVPILESQVISDHSDDGKNVLGMNSSNNLHHIVVKKRSVQPEQPIEQTTSSQSPRTDASEANHTTPSAVAAEAPTLEPNDNSSILCSELELQEEPAPAEESDPDPEPEPQSEQTVSSSQSNDNISAVSIQKHSDKLCLLTKCNILFFH